MPAPTMLASDRLAVACDSSPKLTRDPVLAMLDARAGGNSGSPDRGKSEQQAAAPPPPAHGDETLTIVLVRCLHTLFEAYRVWTPRSPLLRPLGRSLCAVMEACGIGILGEHYAKAQVTAGAGTMTGRRPALSSLRGRCLWLSLLRLLMKDRPPCRPSRG